MYRRDTTSLTARVERSTLDTRTGPLQFRRSSHAGGKPVPLSTPESDGRLLAGIVEAVGNDSRPYREEVCCRRPQPGRILIGYPPFLLLGRYPHGSHFQPCIAWVDPSHGRIKIATSSGLVLSKHGFVRPRQLDGSRLSAPGISEWPSCHAGRFPVMPAISRSGPAFIKAIIFVARSCSE
jgi:hypothetical protein